MGFRIINGQSVWVDDPVPGGLNPAIGAALGAPPLAPQLANASPTEAAIGASLAPQRARQIDQASADIRAEDAERTNAVKLVAQGHGLVRRQLANSAVAVEAERRRNDPNRVIGFDAGTPGHYEQAGTVWAGAPAQRQAVADIEGANLAQRATQLEAGQAQLAHEERLNSAQDIEALKARQANRRELAEQAKVDAQRDAAITGVRDAVNKHAELSGPDPAKYWQGLGFAGSVGMILSDALSNIGAGMRGAPPADLIEKGINRSLAKQQADIDKAGADITAKQGLYAQLRQAGLDKEHALAGVKARRLEDAAGILESYQRQAKTPQIKAQLESQAAELQKKAAFERLQLSEKIKGEGLLHYVPPKAGQGAILAGGTAKQRKENADARKAEYEADIAGKKASGQVEEPEQKLDKTAVDIKEKIAQNNATIRQLDTLIETAPPWWETAASKVPLGEYIGLGETARKWDDKAAPAVAKAVKEITGVVASPREVQTQERDLFGHTWYQRDRQRALQDKRREMVLKNAEAAAMLEAAQVNKYNRRIGTETARAKLRGK